MKNGRVSHLPPQIANRPIRSLDIDRCLTPALRGLAQVWDVDCCDQDGEPRLLATGSYHTAGVWSAHACGDRVLSSSKDGSVRVAAVTSAGLILQRTLDEHHAGRMVKCVRGRDAHVFADCGGDGLVCVLDHRVPGTGVVSKKKPTRSVPCGWVRASRGSPLARGLSGLAGRGVSTRSVGYHQLREAATLVTGARPR